MQPHPRIRKTIKWGGALLTVLLVVVWIGSGWYAVNYEWRDGTWASVRAGRFHLSGSNPAATERKGFVFYFHGSGVFEWPAFIDGSGNWGPHSCIPLWLIVAPLAGLTMAAWLSDTLARRRARHNLCPTCHYDRTGLASPVAVCPECGSPPPRHP